MQAAVLEEVIVTSQKRSENLQDVPIAVNAFTADMIQEMGITNAQELAMLTPSMHTITIGQPHENLYPGARHWYSAVRPGA